ncbi:hypothetical protein GCM10009680_50580 [Streptomyces yatensis]|uniref:Uncharacterized protein n=1 Tax=Streptomyces yatensis TaxID=155177 RepID=A0ABN2IF48_9ACTN
MFGGVWSDVLDQAERVLPVRVEGAEAVGGDSPLQSVRSKDRGGPACRGRKPSRGGGKAPRLLRDPRPALVAAVRCTGPLVLVLLAVPGRRSRVAAALVLLLVLWVVLLGCCPVGRVCGVVS